MRDLVELDYFGAVLYHAFQRQIPCIMLVNKQRFDLEQVNAGQNGLTFREFADKTYHQVKWVESRQHPDMKRILAPPEL